MQSQQIDKAQQIQKFKKLIANRQQPYRGERIKYDWKAAQLSLLNYKCLTNDHNSAKILSLTNELLKTYDEKFVPSFYCYYTLHTIFQRNINICQEIQQQISKTHKSENYYQNILVLIFMRNNLIQQVARQATFLQDIIQKLRNTTALSIIKINEWQQSFQDVLDYPVFFLWEGFAYIPYITQKIEGFFLNKENIEYLPQPNPLLLKHAGSHQHNQIVKDCLSILKCQKARFLQLTLNLPSFAKILKDDSNDQIGKSQQKIIRNSQMRKIQSTASSIKNEVKLPSLSQQELNVIRKFRSLKNIKPNVKNTNPKPQISSLFDKKIRSRIDDLKEKIKIKTESSRVDQIVEPKIKSTQSGIKLILQKQVDLQKQVKRDRKTIIDSLNLLEQLKQKMNLSPKQRPKINKSEQEQLRFDKIIKDSQLLLQSRISRQQYSQKNETLMTIKKDLLQKVMDKNNKFQIRLKTANKKSKSQTKQQRSHQILQIKNQISDKIASQKHLLQIKKANLIQQKRKFEKDYIQKSKLLQQKQRVVKEMKAQLSMKMIKVNDMQFKLEKSKQKPQNLSQDLVLIQIQKLKQKKLMQYEIQKQRAHQAQNSLENKLSEEVNKHAQLKQQQNKRDALIKEQYERQITKLRQQQQKEEKLLLLKIKQDQQKQRIYDQKIKQQEQKYALMQKQISQWEEKEKKLLKTLKQQTQKQQERQKRQRVQRQRRIQKQMMELQEQQLQFLTKYKQANHHLLKQLEDLKQKNNFLEKKLLHN